MKEKTKVMRLNKQEQRLIEMLRKQGSKTLSNILRTFLHSKVSKYVVNNENFLKELSTAKWILSILENKVFSLESLREDGCISDVQMGEIKKAIQQNKNILITGHVGAGKTTILKALFEYQLRLFPERKLVVMEDFPEIYHDSNYNQDNIIFRNNGDLSIKDLCFLQDSKEPTRLIIGEVMDDSDFLAILSGLQVGSSILTTLQGEDWKRCVGKQQDMLFQTNFVVIQVSINEAGKRTIKIVEDY
ncbi:ATPase, T2SS/T4P/T4SS family [Bacillus sp. NPDC094106]|uniref:ATPase, T2SS/T4P/T4SS family n=1 Tax=Bacillus sp. NPDC094106 TaxID=3363949 RepID=UPI003819D451